MNALLAHLPPDLAAAFEQAGDSTLTAAPQGGVWLQDDNNCVRFLDGAEVERRHAIPRTHLETINIVGRTWFVYRVIEGKELDPNDDRLPGVHASRRAANKVAREIGAATGEELKVSK